MKVKLRGSGTFAESLSFRVSAANVGNLLASQQMPDGPSGPGHDTFGHSQ